MITPQSKATIFGRYPNQQVISRFGDKYVLHGLTFGEQAAVLNLGDAAYTINSFSLLLTDLKDITKEQVKILIELSGNTNITVNSFRISSGQSEIIARVTVPLDNSTIETLAYIDLTSNDICQTLMLFGIAVDQIVIENGQPITYSVSDLVANNVFKIRE